MTTSVTIKNHGRYRVNVNEVQVITAREEKTVASHTLAAGAEVTLNVWGAQHYLCILETNDVDTPEEKMSQSFIDK